MGKGLEYYDSPVLRQRAEEVSELNGEIRQLVSAMGETMLMHKGVGLAAPQVGESIRLFVMCVERETEEGELVFCKTPRVFINPVITAVSEESVLGIEGCLSIPGLRGSVYRPKQVSVEAIDINGEPFTETLEGFVARIVMHETDHLNGILYIDKMEMPKNPKKFQTSLERIKRRYHVVP